MRQTAKIDIAGHVFDFRLFEDHINSSNRNKAKNHMQNSPKMMHFATSVTATTTENQQKE